MMRFQRIAPWLALALLVLAGGELFSIFIERWLGVHQYSDMTPQDLVTIATGRDAAWLCLALFGVYAILQAPLSTIGLRVPKVSGFVWGLALGLGTVFIFARLVHDLRLQSSYALQYEIYIMSHATGLTAIAMVFALILLGPIVEEIVFRGIVMEGFIRAANGPIAIVASAVVFAGMHAAGGPAQIVTAFLGGLVLGWLYLRTRSIVSTSVTHIIYPAFTRCVCKSDADE